MVLRKEFVTLRFASGAVLSASVSAMGETFLIVGASILEALFFYILVSNQKAAMAEWKSVAKVESQEFEEGESRKSY